MTIICGHISTQSRHLLGSIPKSCCIQNHYNKLDNKGLWQSKVQFVGSSLKNFIKVTQTNNLSAYGLWKIIPNYPLCLCLTHSFRSPRLICARSWQNLLHTYLFKTMFIIIWFWIQNVSKTDPKSVWLYRKRP